MMKRCLLLVTGMIFLSCAAFAAEELAEPNPSRYPVLEKLRGTDKELTYDFLGHSHGVDAWLLSGPSMMQLVYTVPGKDMAIVGGALVNPEGKESSRDLLQDFMKKYPKRSEEIMKSVRSSVDVVNKAKQKAMQQNAAPKNENSPSEILWQKLDRTGKITFGTSNEGAEIYAIVDPEQPATKDIWQVIGKLALDNKVTLHVVPLALSSGDSIMAIATILSSKDPNKAWQGYMESGNAGVPEASSDPSSAPKGMLGMKATVDFAQSMKLHQLPLLVYRKGGDKVQILRGIPKDWDKFAKGLGVEDPVEKP